MTSEKYILKYSGLPERSIKNTVELLDSDATVPFIARYRKEQTGNLDEVQIEQVASLLKTHGILESRKSAIIKAIGEQEALTPELERAINKAGNLTEVEDLYLPYKKKRKTKADSAREAGLEPLARIIVAQQEINLSNAASRFLNTKINSEEEALQGAKDIIAEWVNEDQKIRADLRSLYSRKATITSVVVKKKADDPASQKFNQYFNWEEALNKIPSHRFLAIYRAANEGILRLKIEIEPEEALSRISRIFIKNQRHTSATVIKEAIEDAYNRLLKPSFFTEFLGEAKNKADEEAIKVFATNLEQLLLSPPLGGKRILGIDPGFRSGCKIVCLDENGSLLYNETIYPHPPQKEIAMATKKVKSLVNAYKIEAIAIGNGTASRETEEFIKKVQLDREVEIFVVNEAGASVYSASKIARDEFPDYDVTVRGSVSIGRRLSDPLAELVKIEPKAIGVGQYQHEVDQTRLKEKLDGVVVSCVNRIGVNVNTASKELLSYVSGIGPSLAENIVNYRKEKGNLKDRKELLKIPRLGAKAFEQAAGFLRIRNGKNPLDNSSVHPERYDVVEKMAKDESLTINDLIGNKDILKKIQREKYVTGDLGLPTLEDIFRELEKPGIDPRKSLRKFSFDPSVKKIEDLHTGMRLPGIVNNITNFGCFVDIGIKESGLIHISKLANEFISDVNAVVKLNQQLVVKVLDVDIDNKRIQLSLID
ncbi:RNA-binding transcriptional accessory protein [Antarcticibacterium sp. 1MA-6-2]|uniref:Tex family protein n=1 Tax=Antarcticibacterium sp. 1MA-6-2 TaxID=2908210 RepID=UPI001F3806CB|nr:Tex family protein [Antarcticibacterium sp. 1MA-6-2]UJH92927.1 RNA-binding transcriptional accessory protein [Antarcticibacterium sp. 1MA-6-2]